MQFAPKIEFATWTEKGTRSCENILGRLRGSSIPSGFHVSRLGGIMPTLSRRRSDNPHQITWHVHYGDLHVGTIGERAGVPVDVDP